MNSHKNILEEELLKNLVFDYHFSITSIEKGIKKLTNGAGA